MRIGHNDQSTTEERANPDTVDANPDPHNVMTEGEVRTGSQFTPEQLARLFRSRYLLSVDGAAPAGASPTGAAPAGGPPTQRSAAEDSGASPAAMFDAFGWGERGGSVQRATLFERRDTGAAADPEAVHLAAARGVAGTGAPMPHVDTLQRAFGHHDVRGVRAHIGGSAAAAAAAIGAHAYATGDDVAFVAAPDLRTAAHEAAHVVQQRGGVQLSGGVGAVGDSYEQHADAVADAVVRGDNAEALLDQHDGHGSRGVQRAVQRWNNSSELGSAEREMIRVDIGIAIQRSTVRDIIRGLRRARASDQPRETSGAANGLVDVSYPLWHFHHVHPDDIGPLIEEAQTRLENWNGEPEATTPARADDSSPAPEPSSPSPAPTAEPTSAHPPRDPARQADQAPAPSSAPSSQPDQEPAAAGLAVRGLVEVMVFQTPREGIRLGRYGRADIEVRVQGFDECESTDHAGSEGTRVSAQTRPLRRRGRSPRSGVVVEGPSSPIAQLGDWCELDLRQSLEINTEPEAAGGSGSQITWALTLGAHLGEWNVAGRINLLRNARGTFVPESPSFQFIGTRSLDVGGATLRPRVDITLHPNWTTWGPIISRGLEGAVEVAGRVYRRGAEVAGAAVAGAARTAGAAERGGEQAMREVTEEGAEHAAREVAEESAERAARGAAEGSAGQVARAAAEEGAEAGARLVSRGAGAAAHVAGGLIEPVMILADFYLCMEHIASVIPGIQGDAIQRSKVNDFADIVSSWVYGGSNQHQARLAMIEDRSREPAGSNGQAAFLERWREALGQARREAHAAFVDLERREQTARLRQEHPTQRELYRALGEQAARRQGVSFAPDDVRRELDGSVRASGRTEVSANTRDARAERRARAARADVGGRADDAEILSHIAVRGGEVVVDPRRFWLAAGIEVSMISAHRDGASADGHDRWRVGLEITDPMPDVETVESGEGPIDNRIGAIFSLTAVGAPTTT